MKKSPDISIIIPVYNESKRITKLTRVISFFNNQKISSELIVVNDGSTDATLEQLKKIKETNNLTILSYKRNKGKGYAIRKGMCAAHGNYRLFFDIDLSTPLTEWKKFTPYVENYDIIIGSRKTKGAKLIIRQPWMREMLGKGFTLLSQIALGVTVSDFTCGFKCYSAKAAKKVFPRMTIHRWGFDSEAIFLAKKYNLSIKEVPVMWKNDQLTRVRFPQDLIQSFIDIITIRLNDLRKKY